MRSAPTPGGAAPTRAAHVAIEVSGNVVRAGSARRRFREGDARSLLIAYLSLVRGLRDQRRARTIEVRRADIEALARYLGRPGSEVVEQLAEVMGATRSQRASMLTLFGSGALVIGLAGSTAVGRAEPAPTNRFDPGPAVEAVVPDAAPVVAVSTSVVPAEPSVAPQPTAPTVAEAAPVTEAPAAAAGQEPLAIPEPPTIADPPDTTRPPEPQPPTVAAEPIPAATDSATTDAPTDDTVVTDIGTPPIPPDTDTPTDDTVVTDIGTPPIPPDTDAPTDDTVVTDIGTPPIPPATDSVAG